MLLQGKNIVITGGGRGIGRSVAIACAKEGANVGLLSRTKEELETVKSEIEALGLGTKVAIVTADVTKYGEVDSAFASLASALGPLNGVVANAGALVKGESHEIDSEEFKIVLDVNITGVFNTFKAAYPRMAMGDKKDKARFVVTGSAAYGNPMPKFSAYTASKYGVVGLLLSLSMEYSKDNLNFTAVLPTMVDTRLLRGRKAGDGNKPSTVLDPEEIDDYFVFLLSPAANKVDGELVITDDFKNVEKVMSEAPPEKKADWKTFKEYLEAESTALYKGLGRLKKLAEFLLVRKK